MREPQSSAAREARRGGSVVAIELSYLGDRLETLEGAQGAIDEALTALKENCQGGNDFEYTNGEFLKWQNRLEFILNNLPATVKRVLVDVSFGYRTTAPETNRDHLLRALSHNIYNLGGSASAGELQYQFVMKPNFIPKPTTGQPRTAAGYATADIVQTITMNRASDLNVVALSSHGRVGFEAFQYSDAITHYVPVRQVRRIELSTQELPLTKVLEAGANGPKIREED